MPSILARWKPEGKCRPTQSEKSAPPSGVILALKFFGELRELFPGWRVGAIITALSKPITRRTLEAGARRVWRATLALIAQNDYFIGRWFDALRTAGRWENTIVIFHADHGMYHGIYGIMEKAPGICSDAICRVPSEWRVPGRGTGIVHHQLIDHTDIAPTLTGLCGLPPMETVEGVDLSAVFDDKSAATKAVAHPINPRRSWCRPLSPPTPAHPDPSPCSGLETGAPPDGAAHYAGRCPLKPSHARHQVSHGRLKQQMVVVAHQHISVDTPASSLAGLPESLQKPLAIDIVLENRFPAVTPAHDVIHRPVELHARHVRHSEPRANGV